VARLDFTVPGEGVKVTVDPNLATTRSEGGEGRTRVRAYVGGAGRISLRWKPRPVEIAAGPPLLLAETRQVATYGEGVLRTDVTIAYRILRAPVGSFSVSLPEGVRVLFVEGPDLRDWKVEGEGEARRLTAALHTPARDAFELKLTLESPAEDLTQAIPMPEVRPLEVLRAQGRIAVRAPRDTLTRPGEEKGVFRLAPSLLPKEMASDRTVLAYRFPAHPWSLSLRIERIRPRVTVVERTIVTFGERERLLRAQFDVAIARAGIFQLRFAVPEDLNVLEVGPEKLVEDWRLETRDGTRVLVVDLKGRREGNLALAIRGEAPFAVEREEVEAALPLVEPRGVDRLSGTIGIQADESFELKTSRLEGLDPLDPGSALLRILGPSNRRRPPLLMAFRYLEAGRSGRLLVKRKRPEVSAESVTRVSVEENRALVRTVLDLHVRYAGVDTFRFALPATLAEEDVVVTGAGIKQRSSSVDEETGRRTWTVTTQSRIRGDLRIGLEYHLAFEALQAGGKATVVVPNLGVDGVVRQKHWYAVTKDPVLELDSEQEKVEIVDPRELPEEARKEGAFLAFRSLEPSHRLTLLVRRHEYVPLLATVVNHLHIDTRLSREGVALHVATLSLKSAGRQFLAVWMPERAKIQEVLVADPEERTAEGPAWRKERPRTDESGERTLIPLAARAGGGERSSTIRIVYRQDDVPMDGVLTRSFSLEAPRFGREDEGVPVGGTSWTLWLPTDELVTATRGNMSRLRPQRTWVRRAIDRFLPGHASVPYRPVRDVVEVHDVKAPKSGIRLQFSRAEGGAVAGASLGSPALFALLQILFLIGAAAAGLLLPRRRELGPASVCAALVLVPMILLAFAEPGSARILNAVFLGGLVAGAFWIAKGLWGGAKEWHASRPVPVLAAPPPVPGAPPAEDSEKETKEEKTPEETKNDADEKGAKESGEEK
jgi:hypothetical protein